MRLRNWNRRVDRSVKTTVLIHCLAYGHRVSRERLPGCLWIRQRDVVWREGWSRGSAQFPAVGAERKEKLQQVPCCKVREKTGELKLEGRKESKKLRCFADRHGQ